MRIPAIILICLSSLGLVGCSWFGFFRHALPPAPITAPAEQPASRADDTSLDLSERLKAAREELAEAQGKVDSLAESVRAERDEQLSRQLLWVSLLFLIGFAACIGAAFWMPVGKKCAVAGAGAFAAGAVLTLTVRALLPYLPWIGLAMIAIGGIAALIILHPHLWTLRELVSRAPDLPVTRRAQPVVDFHRRAIATAPTQRITKL